MKLFVRLLIILVVVAVVVVVIVVVSVILSSLEYVSLDIASSLASEYNYTDIVGLASRYNSIKEPVINAVEIGMIICLVSALVAVFMYSRRR